MHTQSLFRRRPAPGVALALGLAALLASPGARAFETEFAGTKIKVDNLFTVGALLRMQDRDPGLIGKSSLARLNGQPGPCVQRTGDDGRTGPADENNMYTGDTCSGTRAGGNERFLALPGAFTPNGDNGNLNFDKHDIAFATAKLTSDFSANILGVDAFVRTVGYYDGAVSRLDQYHPDTTLQVGSEPLSTDTLNRSGARLDVLDYFASRRFNIGSRQLGVKVGNQVLNWGESSFLLANSLNSINPPNQALLRIPGFDVKELLRPVGMVLLDTEAAEGVSVQAFYQYQWKPAIVDPVGTYFSTSDTAGEGGTYAMLSFAKAPEDPLGLYQPFRNSGDPTAALNSRSSRTLQRDYGEEGRRLPRNGGQYGASTKFFFDSLNNGTELSLYFANYHARIPSVSGIAAQRTCIPAGTTNLATNAVAFAQQCGLAMQPGQTVTDLLNQLAAGMAPGARLPLSAEALPLDTAKVFLDYPENIKLYGLSFNTTVGDVAVSGEYAYRPNLPIQVHSTDLVFALLQPAFPDSDVTVVPGTVLPGRRTAVPDFLGQFRKGNCEPNCFAPGEYIPGFERRKIGQAGLTLLKTIGGDNLIGASQITLLLEMGHTTVFNMPGLDELQFNGANTDTHISSGIDNVPGLNPRDVRSDPNDPFSNRTTPNLRQNPTSYYAIDSRAFGTKYSYGYRFVTLARFDSAFLGVNVEFLNALFHDVRGVGPGLGQNFVEGRKQILSGIRFDYLSKVVGEIRYTWNTGGGLRDALRDRDNLFAWVGYQF